LHADSGNGSADNNLFTFLCVEIKAGYGGGSYVFAIFDDGSRIYLYRGKRF